MEGWKIGKIFHSFNLPFLQKVSCAFANGLWFLSCTSPSLTFYLARRDVADTQQKLLLRLLRHNADTDFGRRYGFASIHSVADYQARVPLSTYEDYHDAVFEIGQGRPHILTQEPVLLLEPTSGSTAATKYIPYTAALKAEFQRAIAPWMVNLFSHHPPLFLGQAYWSVTPVTRRNERTPGGIPIGFEEDSEYLGGWQRLLLQSVLAVPPLVRLIDDMEAFRYVTLLFLLRSRSLALISIWNPTFLTLLVSRLGDWWPQLANNIAGGILSPPAPLAPDLQRQLVALNQPNRRRAAEIEAIFQTERDPATIHTRLWPHLRIISCWADAQASLYVTELARLFPQAQIQGKGLIATEGFISLPLIGQTGAALAIRSHFFEFLPVSQSLFPAPLLAHELEIGCHYAVVITTGGGLYRYQLHDLVEVVGYLGTCPLLRFVGKEAYVSDWFGEKLNERHVGQVLAELFARYTIQANFAMVACDEIGATHFQSLDLAEPTKSPQGRRSALARDEVTQRGQAKALYGQDKHTSHPKSNPAYTLFIEAPAVADDTLRLLGDNLEAALQENYHYRYCRQLGQLGPLRVFRIDGNALATYLRACQAHGQRAGDIKPVALHRLGGWSQFFRGQTI